MSRAAADGRRAGDPAGPARPGGPALHDLVSEACGRHPHRTAVVGPERTLTYAELDREAGALARALAGTGVGRGDRVLLWAEKSCALVAATQAVLRLGAAYVPLHGATPPSRVALVARDCGATAICVSGTRLGDVPSLPGTAVVDLDAHHAADPAAAGVTAAGPLPRPPAGGDDLAYILYTSGSTGTPKGVCVSHRAARAFVDWSIAELAPAPGDRFANHAPFSFDLSVLDLYAALGTGASVHLIPAELAYAPGRLTEFLRRDRITVWYSVPSALILMMREGGLTDAPPPESLRAVLFAGEPFPIAAVRRLAGWTGARLLNLYGPTETNVCTFHEVTAADLERDRPVPIGRAACGDSVRAVHAGGVAGPGEEGELVVAGPTVMLGYWGRPPQRGPYATGDLVRVRDDGSFDYVGRRDRMVKVRGQRVEPGEIEAVVAAHEQVAQAAVVVTGSALDARLAAFVVPVPGTTPGLLSLKRHCAGRLPPYMIPDVIHLTDELPRNANGKVDAAVLAERAAGPPGAPTPLRSETVS